MLAVMPEADSTAAELLVVDSTGADLAVVDSTAVVVDTGK